MQTSPLASAFMGQGSPTSQSLTPNVASPPPVMYDPKDAWGMTTWEMLQAGYYRPEDIDSRIMQQLMGQATQMRNNTGTGFMPRGRGPASPMMPQMPRAADSFSPHRQPIMPNSSISHVTDLGRSQDQQATLPIERPGKGPISRPGGRSGEAFPPPGTNYPLSGGTQVPLQGNAGYRNPRQWRQQQAQQDQQASLTGLI